MKGRVIVLDMPEERGFAAALVQDGRLEDLLLDPPKGTYPPQPGAIQKAKLTRKLPGKGGAFCALGTSEGFLRQAHGLKSGDTPLVQVVSLPEPGKAATVTTRVLFKGPRLILTPYAKGINVSRQIRDEAEAARLREIVTAAAQETDLPEEAGFIIRTSAQAEDETRLRAELKCLARQFHVAQSHGERRLGGQDALTTALTEWLFPVPEQILCASALARVLAKPEAAFGAMGQLGDYICLDGTVPVSTLPEVLRRTGELAKRYGLEVGNVFHAGDGNLHPLIVYDANRPGDLEKAEALGADLLRLCVDSGGCLTGEHGVGV